MTYPVPTFTNSTNSEVQIKKVIIRLPVAPTALSIFSLAIPSSSFVMHSAKNINKGRIIKITRFSPRVFHEVHTQNPQKMNIRSGIFVFSLVGTFYLPGNLTSDMYRFAANRHYSGFNTLHKLKRNWYPIGWSTFTLPTKSAWLFEWNISRSLNKTKWYNRVSTSVA